MEMEFGLAPGTLPKNLKPGDRVKFDMQAGKPGEFVITKIESIAQPRPITPATPQPKAEARKN
jgi:hypothetical protein